MAEFSLKSAVALVLVVFATAAHALNADKDEPIEVEADSAELDDMKKISVYRGNVIVTQGTIRMTGDLMTVHQTEDGDLDTLVLEGKPATYRQLPEKSQVYDEARAQRMEYYELRNFVILIREAVVTQEGLKFSGDRIEYDTAQSKVKAWSAPAAPDAETKPAGTGERVKIIIKKKDKPEEPGSSPKP
jgi:lipopolysaccharide export system protein LptA